MTPKVWNPSAYRTINPWDIPSDCISMHSVTSIECNYFPVIIFIIFSNFLFLIARSFHTHFYLFIICLFVQDFINGWCCSTLSLTCIKFVMFPLLELPPCRLKAELHSWLWCSLFLPSIDLKWIKCFDLLICHAVPSFYWSNIISSLKGKEKARNLFSYLFFNKIILKLSQFITIM